MELCERCLQQGIHMKYESMANVKVFVHETGRLGYDNCFPDISFPVRLKAKCVSLCEI